MPTDRPTLARECAIIVARYPGLDRDGVTSRLGRRNVDEVKAALPLARRLGLVRSEPVPRSGRGRPRLAWFPVN